ncbi:MBOAT family O-acyltransferase [Candidatus Ruminimicrobiellum ovillum]|uniref:MBOAT family O-acyltransferase n=1 Tax=Candidatus Ruminimicrobiellum ovillum TaxID=1947927 RepID=UPI003559E336
MNSAWQSLILLFSISFIIYPFVSAKFRWIFLLTVSLIFLFAVSGPLCFIYTIIFVLISYIGAYYISESHTEKNKNKILILTVTALFAGLFLFKFTKFILPVNILIGNFFHIPEKFVRDIIVPAGISFYTLILVAYVVDVYRKVTTVEKNFFKYLLFSIYFPQLLMGPIVRHNDTKEQLMSQKPIDYSCIQFGILRILWGIFKKLVIADRIAAVVDSIFLRGFAAQPTICLVIGIFLFGFQLYADFSAAMDIVLGISECFGIKLPENFRNPYFSTSFHQYWQRWHITIFTFYRDYIFYPVLRSKPVMSIKNYLQKYSKINAEHIPVFISYTVVWTFAGIWHGLSPKLMFGTCLLPCIYLILTDIVHDYTKKIYKKYKSLQKNLIYRICQMIGVYFLLCFVYIFFIVSNLQEGFYTIFEIVSNFNTNLNINFFNTNDLFIIPTGIVLLLIVDIIKENKTDIKNIYVNKIPVVFHWCILLILITIILSFGIYGPNYNPTDFVYAQF